MRLLLTFLVASWCITHSLTAHAWGPEGHKIVCAVAWDEMRPNTREQVKLMLGVADKEQFADSCNWADAYRDSGHRDTAPWRGGPGGRG